MAYVDLRAKPPGATPDLNGYGGPRSVRLTAYSVSTGTADLVAYKSDLRPFPGAAAEPTPHAFSAAFVEVDVLFATVGGHTAPGGGAGAYWTRYIRMTHRGRTAKTRRRT